MEHFEIPVTYKGKELAFNAKLQSAGFIPKIAVDIFGQQVIYEQDEEGKYRAVMPFGADTEKHTLDLELVGSISVVLNSI